MGYGSYCSIADLKNTLGVTTTTDDTVMRKIVEAASRSIDKYTNRHFYTMSETRYFDGAKTLWVPDLLSINTDGLKTDEDGDATFENTFATTDYLLYGGGQNNAFNVSPKIRIEISWNSSYGSFATGVKKGVEIAGVWGYGDGISATPYISDTTTTESIDTTETAIDVTSVTNLSPGHLILIESEQMYLYSITTLTLTVERGVNGTTAATHEPSGKTVYIYQYPADIRQACIDLAVDLYQNRDKRGIRSERIGDYSYTTTNQIMNEIFKETISHYKVLEF